MEGSRGTLCWTGGRVPCRAGGKTRRPAPTRAPTTNKQQPPQPYAAALWRRADAQGGAPGSPPSRPRRRRCPCAQSAASAQRAWRPPPRLRPAPQPLGAPTRPVCMHRLCAPVAGGAAAPRTCPAGCAAHRPECITSGINRVRARGRVRPRACDGARQAAQARQEQEEARVQGRRELQQVAWPPAAPGFVLTRVMKPS